MVSKDIRSTTPENTGTRHGGRVVLSLDVEPHVRDALRDRAAAAGVSMAEYLANALAQPERSYLTSAVDVAQPFAQISYYLAQAAQKLRSSNPNAAAVEIDLARRIVGEAMIAQRRQHSAEYSAQNTRRLGGWNG